MSSPVLNVYLFIIVCFVRTRSLTIFTARVHVWRKKFFDLFLYIWHEFSYKMQPFFCCFLVLLLLLCKYCLPFHLQKFNVNTFWVSPSSEEPFLFLNLHLLCFLSCILFTKQLQTHTKSLSSLIFISCHIFVVCRVTQSKYNKTLNGLKSLSHSSFISIAAFFFCSSQSLPFFLSFTCVCVCMSKTRISFLFLYLFLLFLKSALF